MATDTVTVMGMDMDTTAMSNTSSAIQDIAVIIAPQRITRLAHRPGATDTDTTVSRRTMSQATLVTAIIDHP